MPRDRNDSISLYVSGFKDSTRPSDLASIFEPHGRIADVYIPKDYYTGVPRGFAYIQYYDEEDARRVYDSNEVFMLDGRRLTIQYAQGSRKSPTQMRSRDYARRDRDRDYRRRRSRSPDRYRPSRRYSRSRSRSRSPRRDRRHSRSRTPPRRRRSPSPRYSSRRSRSPSPRRRSISPRGRRSPSPRPRSISPRRGRSPSPNPAMRDHPDREKDYHPEPEREPEGERERDRSVSPVQDGRYD
ncbi:hypothetical protein BGW42_004891 [Actinomortierella wolfii]|nr:hypothetical protein BGW42_004891 [Actinomortierella wolfii]